MFAHRLFCVRFDKCDAARPGDTDIKPYVDKDGNHITHIYSYNKIMSPEDRKGISRILNRTNFRLMAWYFSPSESKKCGLKNVMLAHKMPMQTTGRENFTVYIYFKTKLWDTEEPWCELDSNENGYSNEEEGEEEREESVSELIKKKC